MSVRIVAPFVGHPGVLNQRSTVGFEWLHVVWILGMMVEGRAQFVALGPSPVALVEFTGLSATLLLEGRERKEGFLCVCVRGFVVCACVCVYWWRVKRYDECVAYRSM